MEPHQQLRAIRERAGVTQNGLAQETGLSHAYVWRVEAGRAKLTARDTIHGWARALQVHPDEIYQAIGVIPHDITDLLAESTPETWRLVRQLIHRFNDIDRE